MADSVRSIRPEGRRNIPAGVPVGLQVAQRPLVVVERSQNRAGSRPGWRRQSVRPSGRTYGTAAGRQRRTRGRAVGASGRPHPCRPICRPGGALLQLRGDDAKRC